MAGWMVKWRTHGEVEVLLDVEPVVVFVFVLVVI